MVQYYILLTTFYLKAKPYIFFTLYCLNLSEMSVSYPLKGLLVWPVWKFFNLLIWASCFCIDMIRALKAVDKLVQKIEFDGPLLTISSKYLAVGVSALNISNFNGTTFSAFIATNTTDPQVIVHQKMFTSLLHVFWCDIWHVFIQGCECFFFFLLDGVYFWLCMYIWTCTAHKICLRLPKHFSCIFGCPNILAVKF